MIYLLLIAGIFFLELIIKNKIEKKVENKVEINNDEIKKSRFGKAIIIRKYHNKGAFLNIGEKWSPLVAGISIVITFFLTIVFLTTLTHKGQVGLKISMSLLLGGGFSNTYDRLRRKYVVDYFTINTKVFGLKNIVFNMADFAIMIGAICLLIFYDK
ncbi:MAG TPA: signal peptidase II [Lachnospiraceae bacterium]|nr:signal peptidase II [Lachnospiraceae bacterium]